MSKRKATSSKGRAAKRHGTVTTAEPAPVALEKTPNPQLPTRTQVALADEQFLALYVANGFNAAAAYREIHPTCTEHSARTLACRRLTKVDVRARLGELLEDRWKALHMTGDEVLARVAQDARCDPRLLAGEDGKLLALHQWPDEIANSVEAIEFEDGHIKKVKLASKTTARRTILEVTGKVKGGDAGIDELAAAMRETLAKNVPLGVR